MNSYQSSALILTTIIGYILITDKNVEDYLILIFKLMKINTERLFWMIKFHPRNPITNFLKEREYAKLAKELEKELMNK